MRVEPARLNGKEELVALAGSSLIPGSLLQLFLGSCFTQATYNHVPRLECPSVSTETDPTHPF